MKKTYVVGEVALFDMTFTVAGSLTDPGTVALTVTPPSGTPTTYTYAATDITKSSTGVYFIEIPLDTAGTWAWRVVTTGNAAGASQGTFIVEPEL